MPSCVCPASWCARVGSWCSACWRGIRISRSSSDCWTCYGVEAWGLEVGVWMLRSALASSAVEQEGERIMSKEKLGPGPTAGSEAGQRRYVVSSTNRQMPCGLGIFACLRTSGPEHAAYLVVGRVKPQDPCQTQLFHQQVPPRESRRNECSIAGSLGGFQSGQQNSCFGKLGMVSSLLSQGVGGGNRRGNHNLPWRGPVGSVRLRWQDLCLLLQYRSPGVESFRSDPSRHVPADEQS